nr:MAG TPA: ribosome, girodazole, girolline, antibiotic complex, 50S [Caudoviricetes sp.]
MNKYQEALEYLTEEAYSNYFRKYVQTSKEKVFLFKSAKALQELVDRATPKKPIQKAARRNVCPNCMRSTAREVSPRYCSICGQRLDWSEYNE